RRRGRGWRTGADAGNLPGAPSRPASGSSIVDTLPPPVIRRSAVLVGCSAPALASARRRFSTPSARWREGETMKKFYTAPQLVVHGDIRQVTRGGSGGSQKDQLFNFDGPDPSPEVS